MNTADRVHREKRVIMEELFADVDNKKCVIDLYLENDNRLKNIQSLSKNSLSFLNQTQLELEKEHDCGDILFFRKYRYENILNNYLGSKYQIIYGEFNMLMPTGEKQALTEKNKGLLKQENRENEIDILQTITELSWEKKIKPLSIIYKAVDNSGGILKIRYNKCKRIEMPYNDNKLLYNDCVVKNVKYNIKELICEIEKTHPKQIIGDKEPLVVYNLEKNDNLEKNKLEKISLEYKIDFSSVYDQVYKIRKICRRNKEGICDRVKEKCMPYNKTCLYYSQFFSQILEKSKSNNCIRPVLKQKKNVQVNNGYKGKKLNDIKRIGLKDFVVRANVFKCMHNKHKIDNVDAMIYIDNDGKKEQVKISAGYCSECRTYFILESTYQKLKKHGMILCRVTDEKNYMKSGYINGMKLAQESLLMQYGYNVSQTEGLSATGRQKILAVIIDNKIMAKSEIISYLDFFISQRSSMNNMGIAISKWETDREFVENYKIGQYTQYGVKAIYRK